MDDAVDGSDDDGLEFLHYDGLAGAKNALACLNEGMADGTEDVDVPAAEFPMAMRLTPASTQSPATSAPMRGRDPPRTFDC